MLRARSRLENNQSSSEPKRSGHHKRSTTFSFALLPLVVLSIPLFGILFYMFTRIRPADIENIVLPNSYLPLLTVVFAATTFLTSFLFQGFLRGLLFGAMFSLFLFLKLQSVILTPGLVLIVLLSFGIIALILSVLTRNKHANVR